MKCPHCTVSIHENWENNYLGRDKFDIWHTSTMVCPECKRIIVRLYWGSGDKHIKLVHPKASSRPPIPVEVDDEMVKSDYTESCWVLDDSPKASAALSRRSLQHILREKLGVKKQDLNKEIQEVIDNNVLPADLSDNLNAIRNIGNFAAHPIKSTSTGEVVSVEPGEAEWNLEVLEELIEYTFVRPARSKAKKAELNKKLRDAGKSEMK